MQNRSRACRRIGVAILLLLAAGCKTGLPTDVDRNFSFADPKTHNDAVVVVGLQADPPETGQFQNLGLSFQRYDPATDTLASGERPFGVVTANCSASGGCDGFRNAHYVMLHVPAGSYVLKGIYTVTRPSPLSFDRITVHTTSLVGLETQKGPRGPTTALSTSGAVRAGLRYYFGGGEIVYLGDFVIDAIRFPARILRIERHDERAEPIAKAIPGTQGAPLVFRLPNDRGGQPVQVENLEGVISADPTDQAIGSRDNAVGIPK